SSWDGRLPKGVDAIVINYDILTKHLDRLLNIPFKTITADESTAIKNKKAKRTEACQILSDEIETLEYRICLTGTPILNRPNELVSQLKFLHVLTDQRGMAAPMGSVWSFLQRYCGAKMIRAGTKSFWDFSGA